MIYHIAAARAWAAAQTNGSYQADSLASEGFIHLSTREQVLPVAERFYKGRPELVLLVVDPSRLTAELRYEESEPGQLFPHLYGPLNLDAVVGAHAFVPEGNGLFNFPAGVR